MLMIHGLVDGQVLQRQRDQKATTRAHGTCDGDGAVWARLTSRKRPLAGWARRRVGRAGGGRFAITLAGIPVGGPYTLTLSLAARGESCTIHNLYVGDVWLLAGQSNMQGPGLLRGAPPSHPLVHALYMDRRWAQAREPLHNFEQAADPVHRPRELTPDLRRYIRTTGVGPGIFFGREMVRRSGGVPQGLIPTAQGASSMAMWDPAKKSLGGASLYGSLLNAVHHTGQPVAGVLWYQGEADALDHPEAVPAYTANMKRLVAALRRDLRQPRLPVAIVQIGKHVRSPAEAERWNSIQEQQRLLPRHIRRLACVASVDLEMSNFIHLSSEGERRLGLRLARLADRLVLGNRREAPAPEFDSVTLTKPRVMDSLRLVVRFRHVVGGLRADGRPTGFVLVDAQGGGHPVFHTVTLQGRTAILEATQPIDPAAYRLMYGYGRGPYVNITDARDMPVPVLGPIPLVHAPRRNRGA